eukprot:GFUD01035467.1.p1 GENE.GFUD01035467.1~~GFUD01035467.1.p1  ORF type:complete len:213 (+),score=61.39 GFUD01035467.1:44-682(+)
MPSKVSKTFLVEIENFLHQSSPVRSTGIQVDIGEDDPSLWCLEISHGDGEDARGLEVSLHRLDSLQVEVDVVLTLDISDEGSENKVSGRVDRVKNEANDDEACLRLENFVNEKELLSSEQFSCGTVSISGELELFYSDSQLESTNCGEKSKPNDVSGRCLTFGAVEELHYIKLDPKVSVMDKLMKSTKMMFKDFTKNIEKDNNLNCLMNLQL